MYTPFIRTCDAAWTSAPIGVWRLRAEARYPDFSAVGIDDWGTQAEVVTSATAEAHLIDELFAPSSVSSSANGSKSNSTTGRAPLRHAHRQRIGAA